MRNEIPAAAQAELARTHAAVEEAISKRDESQAALSRFDAAIADARERMTADEEGFRDNVRDVIREALGAGDEKLFDRIKTRVRKLFTGKAAPVGPDPRIATILTEESAASRLALLARVEEAERALEQATLEHDRVRLDTLAGGINELLEQLAPLILGRAELLERRRSATTNGQLRYAVPSLDGDVAQRLAELTAELQWIGGQTWAPARLAQSRARQWTICSVSAGLAVRQVGSSVPGRVYRTLVTRPSDPDYFTLRAKTCFILLMRPCERRVKDESHTADREGQARGNVQKMVRVNQHG